MPRSPAQNEEIREERREEILAAAIRVFGRQGFAFAKISDIAAEARLSHGLVYHYFESKDAIFGAIVDAMFERIKHELETVRGATPGEKVENAVATALVRCTSQPEIGAVISQSLLLGTVPEAIHQRVIDHVKALQAIWVKMFRAAQKSGEITDGLAPEDLAALVSAMIRGLSIRAPGWPQSPFRVPSKDAFLKLLRPASSRARRGSHVRD
jgi:AcrR family transcriptional regulator